MAELSGGFLVPTPTKTPFKTIGILFLHHGTKAKDVLEGDGNFLVS